MRKLLSILLLLFSLGLRTAKAQDSRYDYDYDSLVLQLNKQQSDTARIKLLALLVDLAPEVGAITVSDKTLNYLVQLIQYNNQVHFIDSAPYKVLLKGYTAWQKGVLPDALNNLKKAVVLFDQRKKAMVKLLSSIRIVYIRLNQPEERYTYYKEKLEYYLANGPIENTIACYHSIAGYYTYIADYNLAISNYLKAASVLKQFNTRFYRYFYNNEMLSAGKYYNIWGNDEKAKQYLDSAMHRIKMTIAAKAATLPDSLNVSNCLRILSNIAIQHQQYKEAIRYVEQALLFSNKHNSDLGYALAILQKAFVFLEQKQPALVYPILREVKSLSDSLYPQISYPQGELEIDYAFYQYYRIQHDNSSAENYLLNAYAKAVNEKIYRLQLKYLKELSVFYQQQNPVLSLQYNSQFFRLNDTIQHAQNRFKVAQYENEQKDAEQNQRIYALRQAQAVQEAAISKRNTILSISLGALVLISVSLVFLYRQLQFNKKTLLSLRQTQAQLIQKEKMASLGELTAGIAHEIQNPLNFINNFSEVNAELLDEAESELKAGNQEEAIYILANLRENEQKVVHYGRRADSIVKSMLEHSRTSTGEKQIIDINALTDEYLRLAYHGFRAKDKSFNAIIQTHFAERMTKFNIVPQDIGRVLLNLFNNAFYAVREKATKVGEGYEPTVTVSTKKQHNNIEIQVQDNGTGIPQQVLNKVFQPFFTTKPTGEGTGLGLSLSYDIVKAHGGELKLESTEGEGSIFTIILSNA